VKKMIKKCLNFKETLVNYSGLATFNVFTTRLREKMLMNEFKKL